MIRVDVKDYCSECLDFQPNVERPEKFYNDMTMIVITDTIIRCQNRKRCECIRQYLERRCTDDAKQ